VAGFCEHSNEPSGSIMKAEYFLTSRVTISFSNNIIHHGVCNQPTNQPTPQVKWLGIVPHIRKVLRSNFSPKTGHPDSGFRAFRLTPSTQMLGQYLKIAHDHFLPHPSPAPFIITQPLDVCNICSLRSVVK
jgi:hypothetical protein